VQLLLPDNVMVAAFVYVSFVGGGVNKLIVSLNVRYLEEVFAVYTRTL